MDAVNTGAVTRWMIRRDMPRVMEIERGSFGDPWTEEDFLSCLRKPNCIGMVAERDGQVVGFMIYELLKTQLRHGFWAVKVLREHYEGVDAYVMSYLCGQDAP